MHFGDGISTDITGEGNISLNGHAFSKLLEDGYKVFFYPMAAIAKNGRSTIARFEIEDNLFVLKKTSEYANSALVNNCSDYQLHQRLGNCSKKVLRKLLGKAPRLPKQCEECLRFKNFQSSWGDVIGSMKEAVTDDIFAVTIMDDASRFVRVECIRKNSEVKDVFKRFKTQAELQTGA